MMLHTWGKCWNTHTETHAHTKVKPQIPRSLLSALHTWRLLISGCWLTPFNRIPLVLGFLCSVEDAHATSPGTVGENEVGVIEWEREEWRMKSGALAAVAVAHGLKTALMTVPVIQALISRGNFSPW